MRVFFCLFLLLFILPLSAQKPITLEDIWQKGTFNAQTVPGFNFQLDGIHYTRHENSQIAIYDLRNGEKTGILLDASTLKCEDKAWAGNFDGYRFNRDESRLLLGTQTESIYRWSSKSQYFVYDTKTQALSRLFDGDKQRYAHFSPDGSRIAFEVNNDLYYKDLKTGKVVRLTTDGRFNAIINGASDWVYEEEFEITRTFDWSPDGQKLAFLRFDESEVPEMTMEFYRGEAYPVEESFKYPKVGEKNAIVSAHVYDLKADKTLEVKIPQRELKNGRIDDYIPRLAWTPQGELCLTWLNRHQNTLRLWLANAENGACRLLLEEKNAAYLELTDIHFLSDGSGFVMQSEKSGFNHLYRYDMQGKELAALSKGNWDVTGFYGIDEKNGLVYYQSAQENPMEREICQVRLDGKKARQISKQKGGNSAQFSSTFDYFIHTYSTLNTPPQFAVCDRKGKVQRTLEQNAVLRAKQQEYGVQPATFFNFKTSDQVSLNGWMIRPDAPEFKDKKLPVLMFVYGGPGSQQVLDQWKGGNYWWFQMLAQQGYVVACVDNRGTGARGEAFKKITYKQLGHYETIDQIEAARYLGKQSFVDPERIGIFGWSYGGYMSSLALLKGGDVFKAGIAVAPVTNWKWYDSVYTERYMQTHEENPEGYEANSPVNFAEKLKGNYLLIHGLTDDNVHFQHSAEMSNQLISKNKQFDAMVYPNRNHGISGGNAKLHLYTMMTKFLKKQLGEGSVVRP